MTIIAKRWIMVLMGALIWLWPAAPVMAADGLYSAVAEDGVTIKMLRYRPTPDASFRTEGQPVLLFPGILTNMNEYLTHTPEARAADYAGMTLPSPLAEWAQGDPYIQVDPMRYYSLAHYLWIKGYDPWFANYRGTGRGEFKSEQGNLMTDLDIWGILDVDPCVKRVIAVTGKPPFLGGHSTGGFACQAYLQGASLDVDELLAGYKAGYIPHVTCDPSLALTRNALVKGYIAIDPGLTPWLPDYISTPAMWQVFGAKGYLDFDTLMGDIVDPLITDSGITIAAIELIFGAINDLNRVYGQYLNLIPFLDFWYMDNTHPNVADFFGRYAFSSTYIRGLGQWGDIGLHHAIREFWKNGIENKNLAEGPEPDPGNDGYYYYDKHMDLISVPTIAVLSYSNALVVAEDVIELLMEAKTSDPDDVYYSIPNSAHVDLPCGLNAPYLTFPCIGDWLDKVCARAGQTASDETSAATEDTAASNAVDDDSSGGLCFIGIASGC